MNNFIQIDDKTIRCEIDTDIFNESVITKALYWLSDDYNLYQSKSTTGITIMLEKHNGIFQDNDIKLLKSRLSQYLIDFKTRDIINQETKSIREILLIKAFANNDDFEDYNLVINDKT